MDNYDNQEENEVEEVETPEVEEQETEQEDETEVEQIDWEARAKKAEAAIIKAKSKPKTEAKQSKPDGKLSTFDMLALQKANIETQEDLDEIIDYAERKNISVAEALKSPVIKATLNENAQIRNSAQAVNTGSGRRAGGTMTDAQLMANAANGKMPSSDEDIAKLARMRFQKKE